MRVTLYLQRRRGKRLAKPRGVPCYLDYTGDRRQAFALAGAQRPPVARLEGAEVVAIGADGIRLRGVEDPTGDGDQLYLQEWWCAVEPEGEGGP